jgi:hypothetical protein
MSTAAMASLHSLHQWQARALEKGTKQSSLFAVGIPFIVIASVVMVLSWMIVSRQSIDSNGVW